MFGGVNPSGWWFVEGVVSMPLLEDDTLGALWVAVDVCLPTGLVASSPKWIGN